MSVPVPDVGANVCVIWCIVIDPAVRVDEFVPVNTTAISLFAAPRGLANAMPLPSAAVPIVSPLIGYIVGAKLEAPTVRVAELAEIESLLVWLVVKP